jgi:PAS domain S-box-containing protein
MPTTPSKPPKRSAARRGTRRSTVGRKRLDADGRKQLHQIELEMQNTELRRIRGELHSSLTRYSALYEFAPVGYLTLSLDGSIVEVNQVAVNLLGCDGKPSRNTRLGAFLAPAARQAFYTFLTSTLHTATVQKYEVELQRHSGGEFYAQISATYQASSETYLVALTDVTSYREALGKAKDIDVLAQKLVLQNRSLTRRMFEMLENDRRRIAHEIQEELGLRLSAMYENLAGVIRTEFKLRPEIRTGVRAITTNLAEMQNGLRRILLRLRPTLLDLAGLEECLREVVAHWKLEHPDVDCEMTFEGRAEGIPDVINVAVFRIVQECLTNIARHAMAHKLAVRVVRDKTEVHLTIEDDGNGFEATSPTQGMGLLGMRERVIALEGRFEFHSQPGKGARVEASIPLSSPALDETEDAQGASPEHR